MNIRQRNRAFTLIELLVVIAIIAILAAILFPVFAQAKQAAKKTADVSNLKNINLGNQLYLDSFDDTWVLWSSGMDCFYRSCTAVGTDKNWDDASAFGLRYMYPQMVNPFIKSGVKQNSGQLKDIWASPLSKGFFPDTKYLYAYNYYTLGGYSGCASPYAGCGVRDPAKFGPYADASYNTPAGSGSISDPANTVAYVNGNILCRPPQFLIANPTQFVAFIAVWGAAEPGDGIIYNNGKLETPKMVDDPTAVVTRDRISEADFKLLSGNMSVTSYTDSHVKVVPTSSLYPAMVKTTKWRGALRDNTGWQR